MTKYHKTFTAGEGRTLYVIKWRNIEFWSWLLWYDSSYQQKLLITVCIIFFFIGFPSSERLPFWRQKCVWECKISNTSRLELRNENNKTLRAYTWRIWRYLMFFSLKSNRYQKNTFLRIQMYNCCRILYTNVFAHIFCRYLFEI